MLLPSKIACPHCRQTLAYHEQLAGTEVSCESCGQPFKMPKLPNSEDENPTYAYPTDDTLGNESAPQDGEDPEQTELDWNSNRQAVPQPGRREYSNDGDFEEEFSRRRSVIRNPASDSLQASWAGVSSGIKLIQSGYLCFLVSFASALFIVGPGYLFTWPGIGSDFVGPGDYQNPTRLYFSHLTLIGMIAGLLITMAGKGFACLTPRIGISSILFFSLLFLVAGVLLQVVQAVLPQVVVSATPASRNQVTVVILNASAMVGLMAAQIMLLLFALQVFRHFHDTAGQRLAIFALVVVSIFDLITAFIQIVVLTYYAYQSRTAPMQILSGAGAMALIVGLVWMMVGLMLTILLLVILQRLRLTIELSIKPVTMRD